MATVFVSHASGDAALAGEVHWWLIDDGHEVFLDQDLRDGIAVGEEWEQRLQWAGAVVCLVTLGLCGFGVVCGEILVPDQYGGWPARCG